ncbi:hypothetical protein [Paenibacillus sp. Marseille-Q7038]
MNNKWKNLILILTSILLIFGTLQAKKKYAQYQNTHRYVLSLMNRELITNGMGNYSYLNQLLNELDRGSISMIQFEDGLLDVVKDLDRAALAEYTLANTHWNYTYDQPIGANDITGFLTYISYQLKYIALSNHEEAKVEAVKELKEIFLTMENNLDQERMMSGNYPTIKNSWTAAMKAVYKEHGDSDLVKPFFENNERYTK